jgi:flagellar basal-body rod modification protein FlgD
VYASLPHAARDEPSGNATAEPDERWRSAEMIDSLQKSGLGKADFMRLLTEQLRHQDPLSPVEGTDFVAQLADLSSLEQMQALNVSFEEFLKLQQLSEGAGLIGMKVSFADAESGTTKEGFVLEVVVRDSQVHLNINGEEVPLDMVFGVSDDESEAATTNTTDE